MCVYRIASFAVHTFGCEIAVAVGLHIVAVIAVHAHSGIFNAAAGGIHHFAANRGRGYGRHGYGFFLVFERRESIARRHGFEAEFLDRQRIRAGLYFYDLKTALLVGDICSGGGSELHGSAGKGGGAVGHRGRKPRRTVFFQREVGYVERGQTRFPCGMKADVIRSCLLYFREIHVCLV